MIIDKSSIENAKKEFGKTSSKGTTSKTQKAQKSGGLQTGMIAGAGAGAMAGMGSMLAKAIPIAALVSLIKPIRQVLEVVGAILSIGLKPLLPILRAFLLFGVYIFKKIDDFIKKIFSPQNKEKAEALFPKSEGEGWAADMYNSLIRPFLIFGGMIGQWLWDAIIVPVFNFGAKIGQWLYDKIIVPIADAITWVILLIVDSLKGGFEAVVRGLEIVWGLLKGAFEAMWRGISWVWHTLLKPVWELLRNSFETIWTKIIKPVWDRIKTSFEGVRDFIQKIADKFKDIWNSLKSGFGLFDKKDKSSSHDDVLITKTGAVHDFNPNDNIFAFQGSLPMGGTNININVDGFVGDEDKLAEIVMKAISNKTRGSTGSF